MYLILVHFRTAHIYDAVELRPKITPEPKSVVNETLFVDDGRDVKMEDNPAYQRTN